MRIAIVNGPNLNLLGTRAPALYGTERWEDLERSLRDLAKDLGVELLFFQSNSEGAMVDFLQGLRGQVDGIVLNPGALGHTSLVLRDALEAVEIPFVEVHLTNIFGRDPWRRRSVLADRARGVIAGLGGDGYHLALRALCDAARGRGR